MCCFEHTYSGIFHDRANRRIGFVGTGIAEVLDKSFLAGVAAIELSSTVRAQLSARTIATAIILAILYLLLSGFHFFLLRITKSLCLQLAFTALVKVALVLLLLTLLSMTKVEEGWNATGLVSLTLITVVVIKLVSIAIAFSDLVDMTGDWSYLIEFASGVILIAIVLGTELLVTTHVAIVAIALGTFLSLVSLMDLHQNMSVNSWWWQQRMLQGCAYHVLRQYTLAWCVRIEEEPRLVTIFDASYTATIDAR